MKPPPRQETPPDNPPRVRWAAMPFIVLLKAYQVVLSPLMGGHCRFHPTCSNYALDAYRTHGIFRATWLTAARLARCHPFGGGGYDPVPLPNMPKKDAHVVPPEPGIPPDPQKVDEEQGAESGQVS